MNENNSQSAGAAPEQEHAMLLALLENTPGGILVEDSQRRIRFANKEFTRLYDIPVAPEALIGTDCSDSARRSAPLFKAPEEFIERIHLLLRERRKTLADLLELKDGRFLERDYVPIYVRGVYDGHYWVYRDVTEREKMRLQLEHLALNDELTGLFNRRGFLERGAVLHRLAARQGETVSVMFFDLNNLKPINDTFGHKAGDEAIRLTALAIQGECRDTDAPGRLGGDEFALYLFGADVKQAEGLARRTRAALKAASEGRDWNLEVSVGIARLRDDARGGPAHARRSRHVSRQTGESNQPRALRAPDRGTRENFSVAPLPDQNFVSRVNTKPIHTFRRAVAMLALVAGSACTPGASNSSGDTAAPPPSTGDCPQNAPAGMACIPAGEYLIGSNAKDWKRESPELSSFPEHKVRLSAFYIDRNEVTTKQYQACVRSGKCAPARSNYPHMREDNQPQLKANWFQAHQYCRAQGKRLPTEAEFEAASRGPEGEVYPWGNELATCALAIIKDKSGRGCAADAAGGAKGAHKTPSRFKETGSTWDVGSRPAGRYGLFDMAGNAQEWVSDWFASSLEKCGKDCVGQDPKGPCGGKEKCPGYNQKLVKGGSWYWGPISARAAARRPYFPLNSPPHHFGFRCARDL